MVTYLAKIGMTNLFGQNRDRDLFGQNKDGNLFGWQDWLDVLLTRWGLASLTDAQYNLHLIYLPLVEAICISEAF